MADETPRFETDTVQADRAREQGLGLGERELNAQRDPGGVRTADEEIEAGPDGEALRENTSVLGEDNEIEDEADNAA